MQNSGVVAKICYYISSKEQKLSRDRRLKVPNGFFKLRAGAKRRQNLRKVLGKWGSCDGGTTGQISIHSTRAFREPCNGGFSPRTPIRSYRFRVFGKCSALGSANTLPAVPKFWNGTVQPRSCQPKVFFGDSGRPGKDSGRLC